MLSGISRALISSTLTQTHGPWLLHLGPAERLATLESMAAIYACLGYKRKEAYVLREVLTCIMDLLICGREEASSLSDKPPGTMPVAKEVPNLNIGALSRNQGGIGVRQIERTDGNDSVISLLIHVCKVLGVNLEAVRLVNADFQAGVLSSEEGKSLTSPRDDDDASRNHFGWPELQVGVAREAIAVAEALPGS